MNKKIDYTPNKTVYRLTCPVCGELQIKIYPWSSYVIPDGAPIVHCRKCLKKEAHPIVTNKKSIKKRRIAR